MRYQNGILLAARISAIDNSTFICLFQTIYFKNKQL